MFSFHTKLFPQIHLYGKANVENDIVVVLLKKLLKLRLQKYGRCRQVDVFLTKRWIRSNTKTWKILHRKNGLKVGN